MSNKKDENKVAVLLLPLRLTESGNILRSLHIIKNAKGAKYNIEDLSHAELNKHYKQLPTPVKYALYYLTQDGLGELESEILKKYKKQKSGVELEDFLLPAYIRKVQEQFEYLKPFAHLIKWYHRLPNAVTGNMVTTACMFSVFKPILKFEVTKENGHFQIISYVSINDIRYDLNLFNRFHFLLESRNEYFLLANKDYQTLEWLLQQDMSLYSLDSSAFAKNILGRLEQNYPVDRNDLFDVKTIEVMPKPRVLLSEISQSFLMLTPQWMYDGYVVEGVWKPFYETTKNGQEIKISRNQQAELDFKKQLVSLHPSFVNQINGWYYVSFAEAQKKQWFLKVYHQLLDMDIELVGIDMLTHFRYSPHKAETDMQVLEQERNTILMSFSLTFGNDTIPLPELQKMLIAGQRAVMLKDGSLGVLNDSWLHNYATIIKHSKVEKNNLHVPQWLAISQQHSTEENQSFKITINEAWWQNWEQWQNTEETLYPVPEKIQASLRPYQQKGFEWMKMLSEISAGACLADDMGLGKTLQTICFVTDRLDQLENGMALIICPSSLMYNWQKEIQKFAPHLRTYVHHGVSRDMQNISFDSMDVCISSYGTLRSDIEKLAVLHFDVAVIDESHNIKNPAALSTKAIYQLNATNKVALSGTPVMNNTFDLYSQLEFLLPGMFGSKEFFKREYADAIDREKNVDKIALLQKLTAPFILRRTKEQVAKDLPAKTESVLWCNMSTQQKGMYDDIKNRIKSNLFLNINEEGLGKSKLAVLQGIMKLKQICSSPLLLPADEQTTHNSVKTEMLLSEIDKLGSHKVLVFSQFTQMLHLLANEFKAKGISFFQLDGSTPPKKRASMVEEFQDPQNETNVFLISLMAGNTGLTLTAADYVFLFDPWWNNAVQQQAIDRTHRIGQTKKVFAYRMICKDTIEEKIIQLQQNKKELSDQLIGDNDGFVKQLTKDDVEFLFS